MNESGQLDIWDALAGGKPGELCDASAKPARQFARSIVIMNGEITVVTCELCGREVRVRTDNRLQRHNVPGVAR